MNQPTKHGVPFYNHDATAAEIREILGKDDPFIIEIGCNDCRTTAEWLELMPEARVVAYDPEPRALARNVCLNDSRVQIHQFAITHRDGTFPWNPSSGSVPHSSEPCKDDWDLSGSIAKPTGHLRRDRFVKFDSPQSEIRGIRLDSHIHYFEEVVDLIWCDPQGSQAKVILGGQETFRRSRWFYVETWPNNEPQYDREPSLQAMIDFLPEWDLVSLHASNALLRNREVK